MSVIYPNVKLGRNCVIEDFCVIGKGDKKTVIGDNAHIRTGTVIYAGCTIGKNLKTGDGARINENNQLGNNVVVGTNSVILPGCKIADNVVIHSLVEVAEHVKIGKNSWIGPGVKMANMIHPKRYHCPDKDMCEKKGASIIGQNVRIGTNATIGPFVNIGNDAIVASGANVIKTVKKETVVAGNPAREIKKTEEIICRFDKKIFPYKK